MPTVSSVGTHKKWQYLPKLSGPDDHSYGERIMRFKNWAKLTVFSCILAGPAFAQSAVATSSTPAEAAPARSTETVVVTGSRIRRQALDSATPIKVIGFEDLKRDGISSPEQLLANLSVTGNGVDNLASQADVGVTDEQRNVNGFSGANLRGQGSNNTLILMNGRRLATHGLSGSAVDVNQLPLAAVKRVEVMADGASAIYGTDAIGGVINYILREDVQGLKLSAFTDITEAGGGDISSISATAGYGDLSTQGFNFMGTVSYRENQYLAAKDRDFIDTDQPDRGLSPDTRGTPFGTIFARAGTALTPTNAPFIPGTTTRAIGGINPLALPGGGGCESIEGMTPFRSNLWPGSTNSGLACAYDTGKAGTLQQPQETLTYLVRGVGMAGEHKLAVEYAGSSATAARRFSEIQLTPGATGAATNLDYVRTAANAAVYDRVFNALRDAPGSAITEAQRGLGLGYRWRCLECGQRVIETDTDTGRFLVSLDGPFIWKDWEYSLGGYTAFSESQSVTAGGYYYRQTDATLGIVGIRDVLRTGNVNPFLRPGEQQTPEALALIKSAEARGVQIAFGRSEADQIDFSINGPLFKLPAGTVQAAFGVDIRQDRYKFEGEKRPTTARPFIEGAPIDSKPDLASVDRDVKAVYAEFLVPVLSSLEVSLAARLDNYSGFGDSVNPKITFRYRPIDMLAFRGSYNTAFRVPTFADLGNPISASQIFESFADPAICPNARPNPAIAGCIDLADRTADPTAPILQSVSGGKPDLKPEEAELMSFGFVFEPVRGYSASLDWWRIERTDSIRGITRSELVANYSIFQENFVRDSRGRIVFIDERRVNAGGSITEGFELALRGSFRALGGKFDAGLDSSFVTKSRRKTLPNLPYGPDLVGQFTQAGELFLEYKHTAFVSYAIENWDLSLSHRYSAGYVDQVVDGVFDGLVNPPNDSVKTKPYSIFNGTVSYTGFDKFGITFGIRNLLDTDPPFARSYLSQTGGGSSFEPRVADPRGRSFTLTLDYNF
jgi:iron complex outermembrane recepter protein